MKRVSRAIACYFTLLVITGCASTGDTERQPGTLQVSIREPHVVAADKGAPDGFGLIIGAANARGGRVPSGRLAPPKTAAQPGRPRAVTAPNASLKSDRRRSKRP